MSGKRPPTPAPKPSGAGPWHSAPSLPTPRGMLGAAIVEDVIYVVGGTTWPSAAAEDLLLVEAFHLKRGKWFARASMLTGRSNAAVASVGGFLYVIGGRSGRDGIAARVSSVERYDPSTDTWTEMSPMPTPRNAHAAVVHDGLIYVMGGDSGPPNGSKTIAVVEVYEPAKDSWARAADLPFPRSGMAAVSLDDTILCFGGGGPNDTLGYVLHYVPATDSWRTSVPDGPRFTRAYAAAAVVGSKVYLIGGDSSYADSAAAYEYDPSDDSLRRLPDMPTPRAYLAAVATRDRVFAIGGFRKDERPGSREIKRTDAMECLVIDELP